MGGTAIYLSIAIPLLWISDFSQIFRQIGHPSDIFRLPSIGGVVFIGVTLNFFLGLLDDFIHIKPHTKLLGQILIASLVTFLGFRLRWSSSLTADTVLTIFWIIGITNAFNLIDNMDGLCAGVALIATGYLALLFLGKSPDAFSVAVIMAGALGAFLVYNYHPASIFMGDSGSLPIGFSLALLGLLYAGDVSPSRLAAYVVPVMILMVPVFDTVMVTSIRLLSGRKASVGGKDHTSHRLVLMGLTEKGSVMFLYGIGAIAGISALFVSRSDAFTSPVVIIPMTLSILLMGVYLAQIRVYPEKEFSLLRGRSYTPILVELTYKRQLFLVMLDFCLIAFVYYLSYRIRFDSAAFSFYFKVFLRSLPAVIVCKLLSFFIMGVYRGIWGFMGINDVFVHLKASVLATLLAVVSVTVIFRFENFSKGVFLIDWFLTTGMLFATRGSCRFFADAMKRKALSGDTVLIYGAGRGGEILLREILNNAGLYVRPVGFIDDDSLKVGKKLQGYPVFGTFGDLDRVVDRQKVNGLLISFHQKDSARFDALKLFCKTRGLFLKKFSVQLDLVDLEE